MKKHKEELIQWIDEQLHEFFTQNPDAPPAYTNFNTKIDNEREAMRRYEDLQTRQQELNEKIRDLG